MSEPLPTACEVPCDRTSRRSRTAVPVALAAGDRARWSAADRDLRCSPERHVPAARWARAPLRRLAVGRDRRVGARAHRPVARGGRSMKLASCPGQGASVAPDAVLAPSRSRHRPPSAFAMTETGGAELLADRLAGDWRYCQDRNLWVRWTGKNWAFDPGDVAITERTKLVAHEFLNEARWALKAEDPRAKAFAQFAATAQRRQFRRAIIDLARSEPGILIAFADFDCDAYLLNFQNGTLSLRTEKLGRIRARTTSRTFFRGPTIRPRLARAGKGSWWRFFPTRKPSSSSGGRLATALRQMSRNTSCSRVSA